MEYARAGAPRPGRPEPRRSHPARAWFRRAEAALGCPRSSTPVRSGASCSASPMREATWITQHAGLAGDRAGAAWLVGLRPEGVDELCPVRSLGSPGPDRPERGKHRGISFLVVDMTAPGVDVRPLRQITGDSEFSEVFLDDVFVPASHLVGELHEGWTVAGTTLAHERGTNFPFKEQVVHETYLDELWAIAHERHRLDDEEVVDGLVQGFVELRILRLQLAHLVPSRAGPGARAGVELGEARMDGHDPAPVGHCARRAGLRGGAVGRGRASTSGRRRPRSPEAPPRSNARSSVNGSSNCRVPDRSTGRRSGVDQSNRSGCSAVMRSQRGWKLNHPDSGDPSSFAVRRAWTSSMRTGVRPVASIRSCD